MPKTPAKPETATKKAPAKVAPKAEASSLSWDVTSKRHGVTFTPDLPMYPGNVVTFHTREGKGDVEAEVTTNRETWRGKVSNTGAGASVSKLIETGHDKVTVTFFEDDKQYATGTFDIE